MKILTDIKLQRSHDGKWSFSEESKQKLSWEGYHKVHHESFLRYLSDLEPAFYQAKEKCEFEFICTLLRCRGCEDAGWDPFETTLRAIPSLICLHPQIEDFETKRHLELWTYGHILEASEPYEVLANLIAVSKGDRFNAQVFPPDKGGRPKSPGEKIRAIDKMAQATGLSSVVIPLKEIWNRDLRNSIFHADYSIHGGDLRTVRPLAEYTNDAIMTLVNKTLGYLWAFTTLYRLYRVEYKQSKIIDVHPEFSRRPNEKAIVIVRGNYGAIGLKDAWSKEQISEEDGIIPWRIGRFYPHEMKQMEVDSSITFFPAE